MRHFVHKLGMWLSPGPIAENGRLNLYAYVGNNPIMRFDALGLYPGQFIVDYWHNAIVDPLNGTLGGTIVSGIEGAGQGASAYFDGFVPGADPFSGNYDKCDKTLATIGDAAAFTREGLITAAGGQSANSVVRSSGSAAYSYYRGINPIARSVVNRGILSTALTGPGRLGQVQQAGNLALQGVSAVDTVQSVQDVVGRFSDEGGSDCE